MAFFHLNAKEMNSPILNVLLQSHTLAKEASGAGIILIWARLSFFKILMMTSWAKARNSEVLLISVVDKHILKTSNELAFQLG